ncbi:MAG TPA: hypothetical protein VJR89_37715 [Polyangiales bacterium]|nr:hypothetical protein [Polyangiales bacterium]
MNAQRWCDAIAAFAPEHRKNLVASTFKGLLLMAGLETPNRARYIEHLQTFCAKHGLDFGSPERVATLTAAMLDKRDLGAEFAPLTQLASRSPDAMYAELMTHVAQANGSAMAKLGPSLNDLTIHGDSANATAVRSDGRTVPIPFLKTANGWFITEP